MQVPVRLAVLAIALNLASPALAQEPRLPTISISAEGSVTAPPDTAVVTVGVLTQAKTAGPALSDNNARMDRLIAEVRAAGVAERDIGTAGFQIEPVVVYPPPGPDGSQEPPRVTGYRVDNRVSIKIRDISRAGDLLDHVVRIGANQVQGISFTVEDDQDLLDQARAEAMRNAEAKARVYAEAGNFSLGRLMLVSESIDLPPYPMAARMQEAAMADSVPIAPGEQELAVRIQVEWEIRQGN